MTRAYFERTSLTAVSMLFVIAALTPLAHGSVPMGELVRSCKWKEGSLGSCRLEINGLGPGGRQPFSSNDGTIHAVVNGELYEHQRIRDDMIKRFGYRFKGGSDSEIVMALYEHYGMSFLSQLRGEYALCLYDAKKQILLAARDRSGIKPLFWTVHDGRLLLASEAKALLPFGWRPRWDVRSIIDKGWLTEERTIFKGLRKVRPGYYLTCLSFDHIADGQYWDHDYSQKLGLLPTLLFQLSMAANLAIKHAVETRTEEEMIEGVRSKMLDAVRVRLQADVPVGIHLSGGIDSAVIAGMAKHLLDKGEVKLGSTGSHHLRCLGIAFDIGSGFDESVIAQNTADFLGVDFQKTHMDEAALAADFEEAAKGQMRSLEATTFTCKTISANQTTPGPTTISANLNASKNSKNARSKPPMAS
ncbi:MAG: hypothetical protein Q9211_004844 [Gyalolechia sp. 1 TL-2023]